MFILVKTFDMKTNTQEFCRKIELDKESHVWLHRHIHWAVCNGKGVQVYNFNDDGIEISA